MTYINRCELRDKHMGKLILCQDGDRTLLFGKFLDDPTYTTIDELKGVDNYATSLRNLAEETCLHKEIPSEGEIIGGTQCFVEGQAVFLWGGSSSFGPIDLDSVMLCLGRDWQVIYGK
jgi:hypothetical protein